MEQLTEEQAQQIWNQLDNEADGKVADTQEDDSPAIETAAPAAVEEQAAAEEDPYAGMTAAAKAKFIGMEAMVTQAANRLRNVEGHIGGLKSQLTAQQQAAQQVRQQGGDAPTASEIRQAQDSPESMQRLKQDYPEFAEAIQSYVGQTTEQLRQELARQQQPVQQGLTPQQLNEALVEFAHPGWKADVQKPEFIGWLQQQPQEIQRLAASDLAADARALLDIYKKPNPVQQQRTQRLESQAAIPSGRSGQSRGKSVDEMTPAELWAYLDKQDKS